MSAPNIKKVPTSPYKDQHPGTSGLRKKTRVFMVIRRRKVTA
jgi:phosphoglucomutase